MPVSFLPSSLLRKKAEPHYTDEHWQNSFYIGYNQKSDYKPLPFLLLPPRCYRFLRIRFSCFCRFEKVYLYQGSGKPEKSPISILFMILRVRAFTLLGESCFNILSDKTALLSIVTFLRVRTKPNKDFLNYGCFCSYILSS